MDWQTIGASLPQLLVATVNTISLTVLTVVLATALAVPLAILRQAPDTLSARLVAGYSWFMRACPLLVILYFCYYGLPALHIDLPPFQTAVVGGAISAGAYYMEIIRGGLRAVPAGQWEAARALGLPPWRIWYKIILPQTLPVILPPFISNTTIILKGSSLASVITVDELTGVGNSIISLTYRPLEILLTVAVIYLALNTLLTTFQQWGERHWAVKR